MPIGRIFGAQTTSAWTTVEIGVCSLVQIFNGSSRNLTPSHKTRDAFMNLSLAFSRDVSLGRLWSHVYILIITETNFKLQVFGLYSRFVRNLIIKIFWSNEPANSTSIHRVIMVVNLSYSFIALQKISQKRCWSPSGKPAEARRINFVGVCTVEMPLSLCLIPRT